MDIENELEEIKNRLAALEKGAGHDKGPLVFGIDLTLPKAKIDGLHFNEQKVHAVFERKNDGWYYSMDILFLSARNIKDDSSRDILAEYLNLSSDDGIKEQLAGHLDVHPQDIEISLPEENMGIKKYNGVRWWYWLVSPYSGNSDCFTLVDSVGSPDYSVARGAGGVALAFRVL